MGVAGEWVMLQMPPGLHVYKLLAGPAQMLAVGLLIGELI
jgi:hypothetical protein